MLIYLLVVIYFCISAAQSAKSTTELIKNSVVRDGWQFFARHLYFVMLKRTYNVTGGLNNSMCVMIPFPPTIDTMKHALNATFTYRNLSSMYKLHPENPDDHTSYWPIARFKMQFYGRHLKGGANFRRTGLDFVNPTTLARNFGYALSPPFWRIMYCNSRCAVVDVRQLTFTMASANQKGPLRKRQCELWVSASEEEELTTPEHYNQRKQVICEEFFKRWCDTTNLQYVYNPKTCAREI